ncbi:hypothetical protein NPIL_356041 [Nephila pilipes]|uniref:Uncharacterized protein n=1 Tax=Nephila pilipes TaxID=299642 RepID=A0A8X6N3D9_NEPPI|nr:hypothetical protein NPIL_356041 [Nephila pilipes]
MASNISTESEPWVTFFWNVENFSYCWQKNGEYICSPEFRVESTENTTWCLWLHPRDGKDENLIYSLYGSCENKWIIIKVECEIAILAEDGSVLQIEKRNCKSKGIIKLYFDTFADREEVTKAKRSVFLPGDTLRIRCRLWRTHVKEAKPATIFARTVLSVEKRSFLWDIERFSSLKSDDKVYYFIRSKSNTDLVGFNIGGNKEGNIMICIKSYCEMKFFRFQPFITDAIGKTIECGKYEIRPNRIEFKYPHFPRKHLNEMKEETFLLPFTQNKLVEMKDSFLMNDVLSLYCEFSWTDGSIDHIFEKNDWGITLPSINNPIVHKPSINSLCINNPIIPKQSQADVKGIDKINDLRKDFEYLYAEGILCDVQLRAATETFPAHKAFLCARSPVFRKIFTTDMKEVMQESVDLPDLDDDTVRRMLLYVYSDSLKDLQWDSALKLYAAADTYEIVSLKSKCSSFLKHSLCLSNVCDVLVLSDKHADGSLKEAAQEYVLRHEEDVYRSDEWKVFARNNSALTAETMLLKWNKK